jgi:2-methylcitrate dehydratase PrpD
VSTKAQVSPLTQQLCAHIAGALTQRLPEEVVERARIHLVDTFAAIISGSHLAPGKRALAYVKPLGGPREAGVIGSRIVTGALNAALANGMCGYADETDDQHPPTRTHPGATVVPAALAIAERDRLPGRAFLRAMVLGYDICARLVLALKQDRLLSAGFTPASKGGVFGAAAAASALLRLKPAQIRHVLSYCAQRTSGIFTLLRDTGHIEKAYVMGGNPAQSGLAAALMVQSGFTGVDDVLSGQPNFFSVYSSQGDPEALTRGLGRDHEILRCSIKYWSAAGPIQGPLHVLQDLMRKHGFKASDVVELTARMPSKDLEMVDDNDAPDTTVQHLLAVLLIDGRLGFAAAHDHKRMQDPKVRLLRRTIIKTIGDPGLMDPLRRWRCVMQVKLRDGRTLHHQTMAARGSYENPLTRAEAKEKALDLMGPVLGRKRSASLIAKLYEVDRMTDMRALRRHYSPAR